MFSNAVMTEKLNIENGTLSVNISLTGAEMTSIIDLRDGCEHLWHADPTYWGRHAPILFPTVGESRDGCITAHGKTYPMGRHGFARHLAFEVVSHGKEHVRLRLTSDERTRESYPFDFIFETEHRLDGDTIHQSFLVKNSGAEPLAFQLGGHPAFSIPCGDGGEHTDHAIVLGRRGDYQRHLLTEGGLYSGEVRDFIEDGDHFVLSHELFSEDAIVFKHVGTDEAALVNTVSGKSVRIRFAGFLHVCIWSVPGASYVCIEPWIGCADNADGTNDIFRKDSAVTLAPGGHFDAAFSISVLRGATSRG